MRQIVSIQGERWDQLCNRAYGVSTQAGVTALREANPDARSSTDPFILPAGLSLSVPDISVSGASVVEVAPWQR